MDIELLLAHPKQGGGVSTKDHRGRPLLIHHFQLQKVAERYGSGQLPSLDILADVVCGGPLSETSTDTADTFSISTGGSKADEDSDVGEGRVKAKRKRANAHQLEMLRKTFQKTPFPSSDTRKRLAKELGMTPRSVQIWFQNQRQLARNLLPISPDGTK